MELANIEKLLEKYLNAETTLQEEKMLQEYFTSNNVAPHLQEYGTMFGYFKQSQSETYTQTIKLQSKKTKKLHFKWMSVAVALLVSVFVGYQQYEKQQQKKQFAQIKEALQMVSVQLNKGNDALYAVSDNLSKGTNAVNKVDTFSKTISKANRILNK